MTLLAALSETLRDLPTRDLKPVDVAVVDSGVDATHPDLAGRVVRAMRVEQADGDWHVVEGAVGENADVYGHGTAVASIIASIAPNARLLDIRVLNTENVGSGDALLAGFRHAVDQRIRVINMSLAARAEFSAPLNVLCEKAYLQNQLVVAARRNMPLADEGFPAEFSSCISVDVGRFRSPFDVQFRENHVIEFVGHGEEVVVAAPGGGHTTRTGTSLATPAVTGLCTLLVGAYPDLRPFDVKSLLKSFSD